MGSGRAPLPPFSSIGENASRKLQSAPSVPRSSSDRHPSLVTLLPVGVLPLPITSRDRSHTGAHAALSGLTLLIRDAKRYRADFRRFASLRPDYGYCVDEDATALAEAARRHAAHATPQAPSPRQRGGT